MNADLGYIISKLRKQTQLSQAELAKRLGVSQSTIAMWEVGKREPDSQTLSKIASFFEVPVDYLLGRNDESDSNKLKELTQLDKKTRSIARDLQELDSESLETISLIIRSMKKAGRKALDEE